MIGLFNPFSGGANAASLLDQIKNLNLPWIKVESKIEVSKDSHWRVELEKSLSIIQNSEFPLLIAGGDGTFRIVCEFLFKNNYRGKILFVPCGRGNDFVRSQYGWTRSSKISFLEYLKTKKWSVQNLDIIECEGSYFLNMASLGYGGAIVEKANHKNRLWSKSRWVYQIEGAIALFEEYEVKCAIYDSEMIRRYSGPFFGGFVGNAPSNGNGLYWLRGASTGDGKLDCIVFKKPTVFQMFQTIRSVRAQKDPVLSFFQFSNSEVFFEFADKVSLELDGDYIGRFENIRFKIHCDALRLLKPY